MFLVPALCQFCTLQMSLQPVACIFGLTTCLLSLQKFSDLFIFYSFNSRYFVKS